MAANTATKTAMSIRKEYAQREPAGRLPAGGSGVRVFTEIEEVATGRSAVRQSQFACGGIVIAKFGVAAPLDRCFELPASFLFAEVFVQQILEKFRGKRAVGLGFQRLFHLAKQRDVSKNGFAENVLALLNVALRESLAHGGDDGVTLFDLEKFEQDRGVHGGEECIDLEGQ